VNIDQLSTDELQSELTGLLEQYDALGKKGLALDLTRGKPCTGQVALSDGLDGILQGDYKAADGTDTRNYGGLEGLPEARALFGSVLGLGAEETLVGGNSSLTMMYQVVEFALSEGLRGPGTAWGNSDSVKFLCPVPGYDRHFAICEHLGIEMIPVPMLDSGPDMDKAEALVSQDESIKGIWCVPRFSNPTGCVYDDPTVERMAQLPKIAGDNFLVMWDNAYAVHSLYEDAPALAPIDRYCREHGTMDNVFQFGSTSKVTLAGAGVAFLGSSRQNLAALTKHLGYQMIGPDKVNQLRHVRFLRDQDTLAAHMAGHAGFIRPRFETVLAALESELAGTGMGSWTHPRGGYFISFDTLPGLASEVVRLAGAIGVKLTPAGATYPYGIDPGDSNIRLSPTFPDEQAVAEAVEAFILCVRIASVRHKLHPQPDRQHPA
jgi:DNA-binding transcriptional MocR family regulator